MHLTRVIAAGGHGGAEPVLADLALTKLGLSGKADEVAQ